MEPFSNEKLQNLFKWNTDGEIISIEGNAVEYKLSFNLKKSELLKIMSGLANNSGGYIIFGVDDRTRKLIGLDKKAIENFLKVDSEDYRGFFLMRCNPNIHYERYIHHIDTKTFGIIYVYEEKNKPCIVTTSDDDLKPGDIYYRYNDSIQKIRYAELTAIIEEKRLNEQNKWMSFLEKIAKIGIDNLILIDCKNGNVISNSSENVITIDPELIKEFKLVDEGHFVDNNGSPTLKLIGRLIGDTVELTNNASTALYNTSDYYKYDLGMIKRKIDNAEIKTSDGVKTKDFKWSWAKVNVFVINNGIKEKKDYCLKITDEENRTKYSYSIKLYNDMVNFIQSHTKEELLNYKLVKKEQQTNE